MVDSLDVARAKADESAEVLRIQRMSSKTGEVKASLSALASQVLGGKQLGLDMHQLNIVLKVDVQVYNIYTCKNYLIAPVLPFSFSTHQ